MLTSTTPKEELRLLVLAVRSAVGIEALTWLTDIGQLSRDEAADRMCWSAQALLHAALTRSAPATGSSAAEPAAK